MLDGACGGGELCSVAELRFLPVGVGDDVADDLAQINDFTARHLDFFGFDPTAPCQVPRLADL